MSVRPKLRKLVLCAGFLAFELLFISGAEQTKFEMPHEASYAHLESDGDDHGQPTEPSDCQP